ncbi:MAG TPA: DUF924 family protein [Pseudomonadales bacterium]
MNFETVLDFWFGELHEGMPDKEKQKSWFNVSEFFDGQVKKNFTSTLLAGSKGQLDPWELTPRGRLAFVIVLDQFPRHIFRGTANAFLYDEKALSLARDGVEFGHDRELRPVEKLFFYMPFQHSENLAIQQEGLALYRQTVAEAKTPEQKKLCEECLAYAERHCQLIQRFGRFPHRNKALGRQSTPQEESYLVNGGARFGQ